MNWQANLPRPRCRACASTEVVEEDHATLSCGYCGSYQIAPNGVPCDCCDRIVDGSECAEGTDLCVTCFAEIGRAGETEDCSRFVKDKVNRV